MTEQNVSASPEPLIGRAVDCAERVVDDGRGLAYQVLDQARDVTQRARQQLEDTSCRVRAYVRDEPVKSLLLAAAAGAAVTGLMGWLLRSRRQA
ncbi:hypothetical protein KGA65_03035 [Ideonella sp. B7]|uniref:hypothetical protein n=1 Tax=Ideonella benzenivorans TaxID=2831643 RepID=UPI001CECF613|nr:hypothetical protein [Ideonella benzenivorans]MCA6215511.1 hypothetical protein [Ideonella benzenivorans]